jgi:hypothetical protein
MGVAATCALLAACSSSKDTTPRTDTVARVAPVAPAPPGAATCPATGLWAECSIMYRLLRSGIAPKRDSVETPQEQALSGKGFVVKFGSNARLEVFVYPDSTARIADAAKLDRTKLVSGTTPLTMNRERTLIENGNIIGLLTSLNDKLRERVSDALLAGAPQAVPK